MPTTDSPLARRLDDSLSAGLVEDPAALRAGMEALLAVTSEPPNVTIYTATAMRVAVAEHAGAVVVSMRHDSDEGFAAVVLSVDDVDALVARLVVERDKAAAKIAARERAAAS